MKRSGMRHAWTRSPVCAALCVCVAIFSGAAIAQDLLEIRVVRISRDVEPPLPLSFLDKRVDDDGAAGAELGLADNRTTGEFLGHNYLYENLRVAEGANIADIVSERVAQGDSFFLFDLDAEDLLQAADAAPQALTFNVRATDDRLRGADCRANVMHVLPSRAMLTDALAQYLSWKRWNKVVLVTGRHEEDRAFATSMERAAKRFGLKIVDRADWTREPGARRTDSGHHSAQSEIPVFTRFKDHDVLLVADERDEFGEYLSWRSERARPVAGTQGLVPTSWSRVHEQWGATQIQRRFEALAERVMTPRDQATWLAMRSIGEAVTRTGSADPAEVQQFVFGSAFTLAGFKGVPLTYRHWNGQLRQPVLLAGSRMLVSVSPQDGFLHEISELDTLGLDQPESACKAFPRS